LVIALLTPFKGKEIVSLAIFAVATLTDALDGFWARRKKQLTTLGQVLDPLADKLLITSALICLVELKLVPAWMAVVIIGREIAVTGFRGIAAQRGFSIPPSLLGKLKMILETIAIFLLIPGRSYLGRFSFIAPVCLWLVIAIAALSAGEYFVKYGPRVLSERAR
jgi:CDP-diacylglycerol--glycerol-3-phosphate 3-phosphatidyltransferase